MGGRKAAEVTGRPAACAAVCPSREAVVKSVGVRWSLEGLATLELIDDRDDCVAPGLSDPVGAGAEGTRLGRGGIVAPPLPISPDGVRRGGPLSIADCGRLWLLLGSSGGLNPCRTVFPVAIHGIASTSDLAGSKTALKASTTSSIAGGSVGKSNSWQ